MTDINIEFARDIHSGLNQHPKHLPSKYFYDEKGDRLFQAIMSSPEYYLTRSEFEILENQSERIGEICAKDCEEFQIVELGAGDGSKTKILLKHLLEKKYKFKYLPIDISPNAIQILEGNIRKDLPEIDMRGIVGDYFTKLHELKGSAKTKTVVLFMGSNIGNFTKGDDIAFLKLISDNLQKGDILIIGFDLIKDPNVIRDAYNDKQGFTREFNLNLLDRINKELGANFDRTKFIHYPIYDVAAKQARSYLISKDDQEVFIEATEHSYSFKRWEHIHMEISQKYTLEDIEHLATSSGFAHNEFLFDCKHYYTDAIWFLPG